MTHLQEELFELQDIKYRDFNSSLIPGIDKETVIGIRTPVLRKFAKEYAKSGETEQFMRELPHKYYEENNLHMMLIEQIKDYDKCISETEKFLPHIDNWATCDSPLPKCFDKNKEDVLERAKNWIATDATYVKRYGMGVMMRLFLDEDFKEEYIQLVASVKSEEYYVNMMIAWYMATALAKQWDAAIPYIQEHRLSEWVHRKSIQKAVESYRITPEQKEYLKGLR
jgi:3-methyladenine DNA glycosylase AlkD